MTGETLYRGWCALCRSRCGAVAVVAGGRLQRIEPDPEHPTGAALCVKGRAGAEIANNPERLLHPLRRTNPKGAADPGFVRISWDEALDQVGARLGPCIAAGAPERIAFMVASPSATPISDGIAFVMRLANRIGTPNIVNATELCNWHKDHAHRFTFGAGIGSPDFARSNCIVLWGHNPSAVWLEHASAVAAAKARGAALLVVDPRRTGFAGGADLHLAVRPGTDAALALAITHVVLAEGWYDRAFVERWTDGPLPTRNGHIALDLLRERCAAWAPARAAEITGVPADDIAAAARLITGRRPTSYYCWTGVGQHQNATQTDRAIAILMALVGDRDAPGGNVEFGSPPAAPLDGAAFLSPAQRARTIGAKRRPLGPARFGGGVTSNDFYAAVLAGEVDTLLAFGGNPLLTRGGVDTGRRALAALPFHVHIDPVLNATAHYADLVLPANTQWERDALQVGFEVNEAAASLVQFRPAATPSAGESRSDAWIACAIAGRLGFGADFWDGDLEAAWNERLAPLGLDLATLRASPEGVRLPRPLATRRHEQRGFATPSGLVELYSEELAAHGYDPLPDHVEAPSDLALRLITAKTPYYCHAQHRYAPSLRRRRLGPLLELHPHTGAARGIADGGAATVRTRTGTLTLTVRYDPGLRPDTICVDYGWAAANMAVLIDPAAVDPVSGSVTHRGIPCEVSAAAA